MLYVGLNFRCKAFLLLINVVKKWKLVGSCWLYDPKLSSVHIYSS